MGAVELRTLRPGTIFKVAGINLWGRLVKLASGSAFVEYGELVGKGKKRGLRGPYSRVNISKGTEVEVVK